MIGMTYPHEWFTFIFTMTEMYPPLMVIVESWQIGLR